MCVWGGGPSGVFPSKVRGWASVSPLGPEWVWLQAGEVSSAEDVSGKGQWGGQGQQREKRLSGPEGWSGGHRAPAPLAAVPSARRVGGRVCPGLQGHGSEAAPPTSVQIPPPPRPLPNSFTRLHLPLGAVVDCGQPRACWKQWSPTMRDQTRAAENLARTRLPGTRCSVHPERT